MINRHRDQIRFADGHDLVLGHAVDDVDVIDPFLPGLLPSSSSTCYPDVLSLCRQKWVPKNRKTSPDKEPWHLKDLPERPVRFSPFGRSGDLMGA